jgi:hypothetical protein
MRKSSMGSLDNKQGAVGGFTILSRDEDEDVYSRSFSSDEIKSKPNKKGAEYYDPEGDDEGEENDFRAKGKTKGRGA